MQWRTVCGVFIGVAAAHWLVIWGPWMLNIDWPSLEADAPQRLQTVWVQMPEPEMVPTPKAVETARSAQSAKKAIQPQPVASTAPLPPVEALPVPEVVDSSAVVAATEHEQQEVGGADDAGATVTAPRMQVRDAAGTPVLLNIAPEEIASTQHQLLRFKVHGFVKGMEYHANAEISWAVEGAQYQARQSISAFLLGSMEQTSQGLLNTQGLQPLEFTDRRFAKRRSVQFDWAHNQAIFTPERPPAAIGTGTQDRLSVFLQLAAMLQAMPQLRMTGTRVEIPTLGSRSLQMWIFVVEGEEVVDVPAGHLPTLRLRREPQTGDDEQALLWVSPAQSYLPARIHLQERNGDVMDFVLKP